MTRVLLVLSLLVPSAAEVVTGRCRAITMEVGQRRHFRVEGLETVSGGSGRCIEEGIELGEHDTVWVEASCEGVRTALLWRKDATRVLVMACAEDATKRPASLLKLRQKLQAELKSLKGMTACVRNEHVELWGWFETEAQGVQLSALEKKYGSQVRNFGERLGEE